MIVNCAWCGKPHEVENANPKYWYVCAGCSEAFYKRNRPKHKEGCTYYKREVRVI